MKALLRALVATLAIAAFAAVPQLINYQGSLTTSTGTPLDTTVSMTFHLYDGSGGEAELLWVKYAGHCRREWTLQFCAGISHGVGGYCP
ncbi:MAG: hypothetical protein IPP40_07300 [bacterium]|nr:hypothetical protein [bacterium]